MLPLPSITHCQRNVFRLLFTGKPHESECLDGEDGFFICDVEGGGAVVGVLPFPPVLDAKKISFSSLPLRLLLSSLAARGRLNRAEFLLLLISLFREKHGKKKRGRELLLLFYFSILAWVLLGEKEIFSHKRRLVLFFKKIIFLPQIDSN